MRGPLLWRHTGGLLALCLIWACGWILVDALHPALPLLTGQAVRLAVIGLGALFVARRQVGATPGAAQIWRLGAAGVCLIAAPQLIVRAARQGVGEGSAVTISALIPVLIVVLAGHLGDGPEAMRMIPAALAGLAGVMLVFHLEAPGSPRAWGSLGLAMLAAMLIAVGSVWGYRATRGVSLASAVAVVCLANAAVLGCAAVSSEGTVWRWPVSPQELGMQCILLLMLELPAVVLLVWLLPSVRPGRLAARYLLTPVIAAAVGYAAMEAPWDWRSAVGLLLMAGAGWRLWTYREEATEPVRIVPR